MSLLQLALHPVLFGLLIINLTSKPLAEDFMLLTLCLDLPLSLLPCDLNLFKLLLIVEPLVSEIVVILAMQVLQISVMSKGLVPQVQVMLHQQVFYMNLLVSLDVFELVKVLPFNGGNSLFQGGVPMHAQLELGTHLLQD